MFIECSVVHHNQSSSSAWHLCLHIFDFKCIHWKNWKKPVSECFCDV